MSGFNVNSVKNTYQFKFMYESEGAMKTAPLVTSFGVVGGALRSINEDSSDVSISSELEQARKFNNIVLYIPGSPGAGDMKTAINLMNFANSKKSFRFSFLVRRFANKQMIYLLQISDDRATVVKPPSMIYGDLLQVQCNLPGADLTYWESEDLASAVKL